MPKLTSYLPTESDKVTFGETHPHLPNVGDPVHEEREAEIEGDDDEDTGADPWWM